MFYFVLRRERVQSCSFQEEGKFISNIMKTCLLFVGLFLTLLGASVASGNTKNEGKTFCRLRMRGFFPVWRKLAVKVYSTSKKSLYKTYFLILNCRKLVTFVYLYFHFYRFFLKSVKMLT